MPDSDQLRLDDAPSFLTAKQVAFILDVDLREVRRLGQRKVLRAVRFGGETMYTTESVRPLRRARSLRKKAA